MKKVMIVDDDERLTRILSRRFNSTSDYCAVSVNSGNEALQCNEQQVFAILLDMMLGDSIGINYIEALKAKFNPEHLIIMTGYASIATTVAAIKKGATDYVAKPIGFTELVNILNSSSLENSTSIEELKPMTKAQVEWEHIQRTLAENNGNISQTAMVLGIHRRSLQRKLQKFSPSKS